MDCEKISPHALDIFEEIKAYYPSDPWSRPQWTEEGKVFDNGWHDLRKKEDREKLITWYEHLIGSTIVVFAGRDKYDGKELSPSVFHFEMYKKWIELAVLLKELDFQIETLDLAE